MTRAEIFRSIATVDAVAENEEFVNALLKEAESLEKRAAARVGKQTKTQKENIEIKERIRNVLAECDKMTASAVAETIGISTAKATALLTQMKNANEIVREQDKKVAYFHC